MSKDVPITEILDSIKKMIDSKSLVKESSFEEGEENIVHNRPLEDDSLDSEDDVLELTEVVDLENSTTQSYAHKDSGSIESDKSKLVEQISPSSVEKVTDKFKTLKEVVKKADSKDESISRSSDKTINDFLKDAMKPYIITWLDENLPKLVYEIVDREVKKLVKQNEKT